MLKKYIKRHWATYIAIILVPIIFWCAVYSVLDDPKDNEKFAILFVGTGLDSEALQEHIITNLWDSRIKSIEVESITLEGSLYYDYLKSKCYAYDLVIFSESYIQPHVGRVVFEREIMLSQCSNVLPESEYYYENIDGVDIPFGFILDDGDMENLFTKYYSGDEKCYLFLSPQSVNLDTINGKGAKGDDFALKVLNALFQK